jgi:hypothetical protein
MRHSRAVRITGAVLLILVAVINLKRRQGLARTAVTTSRLMGILRGEIRPPSGADVETAADSETPATAGR